MVGSSGCSCVLNGTGSRAKRATCHGCLNMMLGSKSITRWTYRKKKFVSECSRLPQVLRSQFGTAQFYDGGSRNSKSAQMPYRPKLQNVCILDETNGLADGGRS